MITEDYVSFETAKLLKEKGFNENTPVNYFIGDDKPRGCMVGEMIYHRRLEEDTHLIACPTLQMAMKWLGTIHNIDIETLAEVGILGTKVYVPMISMYKNRKDAPEKLSQLKFGIYDKDDKGGVSALKYYKTKEEACEDAIRYTLEKLI